MGATASSEEWTTEGKGTVLSVGSVFAKNIFLLA